MIDFFAGPNKGELDWFIVDEEFNQYANDLLSKVAKFIWTIDLSTAGRLLACRGYEPINFKERS